MKKYIYLVSYHYKGGIMTGFGNLEVNSTQKIENYSHIVEIQNLIKKNQNGTGDFAAVILNFILLRTEEQNESNIDEHSATMG